MRCHLKAKYPGVMNCVKGNLISFIRITGRINTFMNQRLKSFIMQTFSSIKDFKKELVNNPQLQQDFKTDPVQAAEKISERPLDTDVWIYRMVVFALGGTILAIIIGVISLISSGKITEDKNVPTILTAIGSAAIGALAGLLAPSPRSVKE